MSLRSIRLNQIIINNARATADDEYHCEVATTIKEATQLIEKGFEYVAEKDGTMIFRKRK